MARLNFILLAFLFALAISSVPCFEAARKMVVKTEKQTQADDEPLLEATWSSTTSPLSVLPKGGSSTPPKGHPVTNNAEVFVDTNRFLQSVPSPGKGH